MSEEKKLTDEEIVKALECCINECDCENCPYGNNDDCVANVEEILDLIHRLQGKNETQRKIIEYQDGLPDLVEQQKAEIERLTEELATAKQELVNEQRYYENAYSKACQLETQNAELQKQVDELKERYLEESKERCKFEQLYGKIRHEHNIGLGVQRKHWVKKVEQAVKETAEKFAERVKMAFYYHFDELIPSIMADKIDEICKELTENK